MSLHLTTPQDGTTAPVLQRMVKPMKFSVETTKRSRNLKRIQFDAERGTRVTKCCSSFAILE